MFELSGRNSRIESIDFLRGIAVWLVLFRHHQFWPLMNQYGWIGVDLFFVLSGFLVSGLLFSEYKKFGSVKPGQFILRRGFKIYPHFYLFLVIGLVTEWIYRSQTGHARMEITSKKLFGELVFFQNYIDRIWSQSWSLAVEEHFYIGLAFTFFLFAGWKKFLSPGVFVSLVSLLLLAVLGERYFLASWNFKKLGFYYTHTRIDSLAFGVLLSYFNAFYKEKVAGFTQRFQWPLLALAAVLFTVCYSTDPKHDYFTKTLGFTLLYLGFGALLLVFVYTPIYSHLKKVPVLAQLLSFISWSGFCSYGIYLWHVYVERYIIDTVEIDLLRAKLDEFQVMTFPLYIGATLLISYFATEYFESPILKLRDKWIPKRSAAA